MTVPANETLDLTNKARAELELVKPPALPVADWCSSLWDSADSAVRHQCVRGLHHDGRCQCVCGEER